MGGGEVRLIVFSDLISLPTGFGSGMTRTVQRTSPRREVARFVRHAIGTLEFDRLTAAIFCACWRTCPRFRHKLCVSPCVADLVAHFAHLPRKAGWVRRDRLEVPFGFQTAGGRT